MAKSMPGRQRGDSINACGRRCTSHSIAYHMMKPISPALLQDNREVESASEHIHNALGKVPIVEWFVRKPADESSLERFFARLLG